LVLDNQLFVVLGKKGVFGGLRKGAVAVVWGWWRALKNVFHRGVEKKIWLFNIIYVILHSFKCNKQI
jgi:hypothetical protein